MASCTDLSASSINCSAPPLIIRVEDLDLMHLLKILYLSAPICFSSKYPQVPKISGFKLLQVCCSRAPVDLATLFKSSSLTLPAQKMFLSAKYCVAKSPIGSFDSTTLAPKLTILSSLA